MAHTGDMTTTQVSTECDHFEGICESDDHCADCFRDLDGHCSDCGECYCEGDGECTEESESDDENEGDE